MYPIENCWYRISAKALILNDHGEILLCKESNGYWNIPGGGLDHGENVYDSIVRELSEEMGLEVVDIEKDLVFFLTAHKPASKSRPWIANICYKVKTRNFDFKKSDECVEIGFFAPQEIFELQTIENVKELAKQMMD